MAGIRRCGTAGQRCPKHGRPIQSRRAASRHVVAADRRRAARGRQRRRDGNPSGKQSPAVMATVCRRRRQAACRRIDSAGSRCTFRRRSGCRPNSWLGRPTPRPATRPSVRRKIGRRSCCSTFKRPGCNPSGVVSPAAHRPATAMAYVVRSIYDPSSDPTHNIPASAMAQYPVVHAAQIRMPCNTPRMQTRTP